MPDKKMFSPDGSIELVIIDKEEIKRNINDIISSNIAVFRLNIDNKLVTIPLEKLDHYLGETSSKEESFYIGKNWENKIGDITTEGFNESVEKSPAEKISVMEAVKKYGNATEQMEKFRSMTIVEREEILDVSIEKLHAIQGKTSLDLAAIIKMVEVVANTFYANYANMDDDLSSENVKNNLIGIYIKTEWVVKLVIELFKNNRSAYENYKNINNISTGSVTIDNINKNLLWFVGFCLFYNDYIDKGLVTKKIRVDFKERYLRYYVKRMPNQNLTIERIIKGGFRRIDVDTELQMYAIGALLYDIGKLPFVSYHDSDEEYIDNIVKMHVLLGYNLVLKTKKYPFVVAAMAAFHHEYYGGKNSYNFTNPIISKLIQKKRTDENTSYFITYDEKEFKDGIALSYFPCKIMEIVDIFNALVNKKKNSHSEALKIMKKKCIAQSLKVDPLIYEIFLEFIQSCGLITEKNREEINAIIY